MEPARRSHTFSCLVSSLFHLRCSQSIWKRLTLHRPRHPSGAKWLLGLKKSDMMNRTEAAQPTQSSILELEPFPSLTTSDPPARKCTHPHVHSLTHTHTHRDSKTYKSNCARASWSASADASMLFFSFWDMQLIRTEWKMHAVNFPRGLLASFLLVPPSSLPIPTSTTPLHFVICHTFHWAGRRQHDVA